MYGKTELAACLESRSTRARRARVPWVEPNAARTDHRRSWRRIEGRSAAACSGGLAGAPCTAELVPGSLEPPEPRVVSCPEPVRPGDGRGGNQVREHVLDGGRVRRVGWRRVGGEAHRACLACVPLPEERHQLQQGGRL